MPPSRTQQRKSVLSALATDKTSDGDGPSAPRAGLYARISQDRSGEGLGVERQEEFARAEADRRGWEVVRAYVDNNMSASKGGRRPQYELMLADIQAGRINAVISYDNSRLTRSLMERAEFMRLCDQHDVKVGFVKGQADLETAHGRMVYGILAEVATAEAAKNAERISDAFAVKRRKGEWLGGPRPFGWNVERELSTSATVGQELDPGL